MANIKRLKENCPWCNKKTVGQDESGFETCVKCDFHSDPKKFNIDQNDLPGRIMKIYDALICSESNPDVRFTCVCSKLKGHKGEHKDQDHPEFGWIS